MVITDFSLSWFSVNWSPSAARFGPGVLNRCTTRRHVSRGRGAVGLRMSAGDGPGWIDARGPS